MRRLPVFLLIDTSESMVGEAIESLNTGLESLLTALKRDPQTIEIGALSILTFGSSASVSVPLSAVLDIQLPQLELSSGTCLGSAFDLLTREIADKVVRTTAERRGDYRPIVFLITDGQPTDEWSPAVARFRKAQPSVPIYAIGCGEDVDFSILKGITPNTYFMREMDATAFGKLFACVSASVRSLTDSAITGSTPKDDLAELAKDAIRKPTDKECRPLHELRQVFIPAICSKQRKHYLLRYRLDDSGGYYCAAAHKLDKPMPSAEEAVGTINTSQLGLPLDCPYCGNDEFFYCHSCNTASCIAGNADHHTCPTCGWNGSVSRRAFDMNRSHG